MPNRSASSLHCVPLPEDGGPQTTKTLLRGLQPAGAEEGGGGGGAVLAMFFGEVLS